MKSLILIQRKFRISYALSLIILLFSLIIQSCSRDSVSFDDNQGTIDLSNVDAISDRLKITNASKASGKFPEESFDSRKPFISFSNVYAQNSSFIKNSEESVNILKDNMNKGNISESLPLFLSSQRSDLKNQQKESDKLLSEEITFFTIVINPGQQIKAEINVKPMSVIKTNSHFNIKVRNAKNYYKVQPIVINDNSLPELEIKTSKDFRPGIFYIDLNLTIYSNENVPLTSNTITINVIVTLEPGNKKLIKGKWEIVKQAPLPGTIIGYNVYMPNYVGNYLIFNSDSTGFDQSIAGLSVPFSYRIYESDGKLILDFYDAPRGTGIQGAKYYILTLNSTTMILNELMTGYQVKRYVELKRK